MRANDAKMVRRRDAQCNTEQRNGNHYPCFFRVKSDSSVLHCESLLRMVFASLARAYDRKRFPPS